MIAYKYLRKLGLKERGKPGLRESEYKIKKLGVLLKNMYI